MILFCGCLEQCGFIATFYYFARFFRGSGNHKLELGEFIIIGKIGGNYKLLGARFIIYLEQKGNYKLLRAGFIIYWKSQKNYKQQTLLQSRNMAPKLDFYLYSVDEEDKYQTLVYKKCDFCYEL